MSEERQEFSVTELSGLLRRTVEDSFGFVRVRGEISGFKRAASGHMYFNLKDENAVLNAICWRGTASRLPFMPEDGLEVICSGKITTYPQRSNYQIIAQSMEVAGTGALMEILQKRKEKLTAEGLFDASRKKPLPFLPSVIGVVTSPTGSVIRDILHRLEERFGVHVLIYPVLVQGEGAASQIANAIESFNDIHSDANIPRPDLLIVARGGGSIEDLWAFNEEIVVRATADSDIPLISAVGHETDTTLIDYASDVRAPTPTAAAEIAVPVKEELLAKIYEIKHRLYNSITRFVDDKQSYLLALSRGILSPQQRLEIMTQRLDDWSERLISSISDVLRNKNRDMENLSLHIRKSKVMDIIEKLEQKLLTQEKLLDSYHYKKVLGRGFALVRSDGGDVLDSAKKISSGKMLHIELKDGIKTAMATGKNLPKKKHVENAEQQSLF